VKIDQTQVPVSEPALRDRLERYKLNNMVPRILDNPAEHPGQLARRPLKDLQEPLAAEYQQAA
jgi:hypothetical protein